MLLRSRGGQPPRLPSTLSKMLLILTNSIDGTSDEIVRRVGAARAFRFNVDLWQDYQIEVTGEGFALSDPSGRHVHSHQIEACYVRKPTFDDPLSIPEGGCLEAWQRSQISYLCQELYNICKRSGKIRLVEKGAQQRFGKFSQMQVAANYFSVPSWRFTKGSVSPHFDRPTIAKTLVADFVENYRVFFTTRVESGTLDPQYPWFLQDEVDADFDLTVVYVAGRSFAFTLDRNSFDGVDWRKQINKTDLPWIRYKISQDFDERIRRFMTEAQLEFGRLDFLLADGIEYFLEVNPNGQWAWLDMEGKEGVFDAVIAELTKNWTEQHCESIHRSSCV
jgi:hypothetical protein